MTLAKGPLKSQRSIGARTAPIRPPIARARPSRRRPARSGRPPPPDPPPAPGGGPRWPEERRTLTVARCGAPAIGAVALEDREAGGRTGAIGKGFPASAVSAWAVTHTGVCEPVRE